MKPPSPGGLSSFSVAMVAGLWAYDCWTNGALAADWVLAVIVLRRMRPDLRRPYRVSGYPFVPAAFLIAAACFILNTLLERPVEAGIGSGSVALGIPACRLWKRRSWAARRAAPLALGSLFLTCLT
jgi:hypothetical protein